MGEPYKYQGICNLSDEMLASYPMPALAQLLLYDIITSAKFMEEPFSVFAEFTVERLMHIPLQKEWTLASINTYDQNHFY
jgi:hypothetical protein